MFGLSFGELCVLLVVAIVVIGPKDLPKVLRRLGQWAGKLRRMATEVRAQSGIDEVLRTEGLTKEIAELRRLAQGDLLDPVPLRGEGTLRDPPVVILREREYPREGPDNYSAMPDTALAYAHGLPPSPLATDPLYVTGDATAKLEPKPAGDPDAPAAEPAAAPGPGTA